MKKMQCLAVLLSALLPLLSGCGAAESSPPETPAASTESADSAESADAAENAAAEALGQRSLAYLDQFQRGEVAPFYEDVTGELKAQLPQEAFAAQWAAILAQTGPQESAGEPQFQQTDGGTAVTIEAVHTLRRLVSTFVYDADGRIAGVGSRFQPLVTEPQATELWEEIPVQIGAGEKKLNGLLTLPKDVQKPPVAILLQGSGPSNMDEKIGTGGNRPFADLAHGLAGRGVASIRYDKRTYAYPEDCAGAGIACEYLDDAAAAIALARGDGRVDAGRVFLIGHSEGGMLAPKIAQDHPEIRGIVSLAGTLRRLEDVMLDQVRRQAQQETAGSDGQKQAYLAQVEAEVRRVKELDPAARDGMILGASAAYWNSLNSLDLPAIARGLDIPMLILQGGEDFQVSAEEDFQLWKDVLAGRDGAKFRLYPGLSHLFSKAGSKDRIDTTVYDAPAPMDEQVIADIADWIADI